ncbi:hypothetical protein LPJ61_001621 [Coemansia biformis]|uniref:Uncharacterized protein n=1 Tax=Coemansia biformis TaxID=1286918 RepID=A0A9W8CZX0_9FUNG|nr:hypothetical protein LPJ61_001621 [Coemansia biformis]
MASPDPEAAARVCRIAADLSVLEPRLLESSLLHRQKQGTGKRYSLGGALASLWQAPTHALTHTLFRGGSAEPATGGHQCVVESELMGPLDGRRGMVWLAWADCRCLFQVFRALEYVDGAGKPTALVGTLVSRLAAGETVGAQEESSGRARHGPAQYAHGGGAARLWRWGGGSGSSSADDDSAAGGGGSEQQTQSAAWALISRIFARTTALRISADAEEVSESDAQAVLTWFPQLEYLEIQRIPHAALRFWGTWLPDTLGCLKMVYAGIDLDAALGLSGDGSMPWQRLELLDLSDNPGIDLGPLRGPLAQQRLPAVARLSLARCELDSVPPELAALYSLAWLDLRGNAIADVADISLRVGGIARLCLAQNGLADISGLRRLWALEVLDVSDNALAEWEAVLPLRNMPSLRELAVRGNPFAQEGSGYQVQIFSAFDHRDVALALDGHGPTGQERREMAKVTRVATEHRAGAPAAPEAPPAKARRPKVAVIEESEAGADEEVGDRDVAVAADDQQRDGGRSAAGQATLEKTPRVLRATELQAVAVASAHRRSRVGGYLLAAPGVPPKARGHFRRRATATTLGEAAGVSIPHAPRRQATYSVPASYVSRPSSPAPSIAPPSVAGSLRDPERYRRRVEMMRAEAGSLWLRAFTELQAQTPPPHAASPSGPPASLPTVSEANGAVSTEPRPEEPRPAETTLPTSLFPRRKHAAHKDVARLPRNPRPDVPQADVAIPPAVVVAAAPVDLTEAEDTTAEACGVEGEDCGPDGSSSSGRASTASEQEHASMSRAQRGELQQILWGEGVQAEAARVSVARFWLATPEETPLADDGNIANGSRVVERADCGHRDIYVTATEVVEIVDDDEAAGSKRIAARLPLSALTRTRQAGDCELVEVKADRFEMPQWIAYRCHDSGGDLVAVLRAAAADNTARGQQERVFRQAECLRCSWKGFVDRDREAWDALEIDERRTAVPSPAAELRCPGCGRTYMREFYDEQGNADASGATGEAWTQPLVATRRRAGTGPRRDKGARDGSRNGGACDPEQVRSAQRAAAADVELLGSAAVEGAPAFGEVTNAIRLFLQLSVFAAEGERLVQWVAAGLVRQVHPLVPDGRVAGGKWALPAFLGSAADGEAGGQSRARAVETDWQASAALAPETAEQTAFVALSTHAMYVFTPTWDALRCAGRADVELQPEQHLGLLFAIPLAALGRIDVGPNRQYIALHAALLAEDASAARWSAAALPRLLATGGAAYPTIGQAADAAERRAGQLYVARAGALQRARRAPRRSLFVGDAAASCVFMLRDRLTCSDLLDALVELGYETRVLDSGAGAGSGRLRALNQDVEWAMHHLVRHVFLQPATFADVDADGGEGDGSSDSTACLVAADRRRALRSVRDELLRTRSGRQPGAMLDPAGGGAAVVDQVTYEFLRLYLCVGRAVPGVGMEPLTLAASPHFVYVVRERVDVWPPPVPDLRVLYRKWQREPPPTIVTSDPDAYDPQALAEELARRTSGAAGTPSPPPAAPADSDRLAAQLVAAAVEQYDRIVHARPAFDLRRITLVPHVLTVVPAPEDPGDPRAADVLGCTGTGWRAMLRIEFDTVDDGDAAWCLWFASVASAQECSDALLALATAAGGSAEFSAAPAA